MERVTPLTKTTGAVLRAWLAERQGEPREPLFPNSRGRRLSRDGLERRLAKHLATAGDRCPALKTKHVTLHALRHTAAMQLLNASVETTVIALWLGHERVDTTQIYPHADLALKERALARTEGASHPLVVSSSSRQLDRDARTAEVDEGDHGAGGVKAEAAVGDQADAAVESLQASVDQAEGDRGEDAVTVQSDGARKLDERVELGSGCPGQPGIEMLGRRSGILELVEQPQLLLQQEGAVERAVGLLD